MAIFGDESKDLDKIDVEFIRKEIEEFVQSDTRERMLDGIRYFLGDQDILKKKRTVVGKDGELIEVDNLPNNRVVDNQYRKLVIQKSNYLLGNDFKVLCKDDTYHEILEDLFNRDFRRMLMNVCVDSLNCGLGWIFISINDEGELIFQRVRPEELIPLWKDSERTVLDAAIRFYKTTRDDPTTGERKELHLVEVYDEDGIYYFEYAKEGLTPIEPFYSPYILQVKNGGQDMDSLTWGKIPLIPFRYNGEELPLIVNVKSLQDGLNTTFSDFMDQMQENPGNTILIIKGYGGEDLGVMRKNLATYRAVKIDIDDGGNGAGVDTLHFEINAENYNSLMEMQRRSIIENGMGYDAKDDRLLSDPNQMNIQSMFTDVDMDADRMEMEYQFGFEQLFEFINQYLLATGQGDYFDEKIDVTFDRAMMVNRTETIQNVLASVGVTSLETALKNHPWVGNVLEELEKIEKERGGNRGGVDDGEVKDYNDYFKRLTGKVDPRSAKSEAR